MKQFNYDLLENKRHLLEQDNSGSDRVYHGPNGTYASVTNMLYYMVTKPGIDAWKERVGEEEAKKISTRAASRGTRIHNSIEKYLRGDDTYFEGVPQENRELIQLGLKQIDERVDNIRGIELGMWSDSLGLAGTSDLVADYQGELSIIDWKTATYIKKEEIMLSYILQGTAYSRMLYELYGMIPKKIVICSFIRFDSMKPNPFMDQDIYIDWRVYNPLDYIRRLKSIVDAFHYQRKQREINNSDTVDMHG